MVVPSLVVKFEYATENDRQVVQATAPWGSAVGDTFEEAYWAVMRLPR